MSDEGSEEIEVPPEPPKEDPGKKFFISHLNSYIGKALLKELRNEHLVREAFAAHTFSGTLKEDEPGFAQLRNPIPDGVQSVVSMDRTKEFRDKILHSNVIVYDLMTNKYEEVDYVIKTLKTSNFDEEKTLILLSSVMTWANTPAKIQVENVEGEEEEQPEGEAEPEEEEEEEPEEGEELPVDENGEPIKPKKILFFKESDYHLRVPATRFQHLKTLETLAMSSVNTQPKLKVHVVCSGIRYGNGEETFFELFRQAWLQNPQALAYTQKGDNLVPTIHVIDLARIVKRLADTKPNHPYIFAIDRTKKPTQKRIIEAISKGIGTGQVVSSDENNQTDWQEFLNINLKMKTSVAFKDGEPPEDAEDPEEEAKKLKFPWHCEKGIIDNALKLNIELNETRGLRPVKIFVSGPPASGKTFYSNTLAWYYNISRIHAKELVDTAYEMSKSEEEGNELIEEIRSKIEELRDEMVAKIEESRPEDQEEPEEIDRETLPIRFPDDLLYKLLRIRLNENSCRNRGYVLDGFPRTFKDAQYIFLVKRKIKNEDGEEVEEEDEEVEEGEEKNFDKYIPDQAIFPQNVIVIKGEDEFLKNRVRELKEELIAGTHYTNEDMIRRLKFYRTANNSTIAEPSVQDFFIQKGINIIEVDCTMPEQKVIASLKIYIERKEKPFNYMTFDTQEAQIKMQTHKFKLNANQQEEESKKSREEQLEKELRRQKEAYTKSRFDQIKEYERDVLDGKSQPIRQYLMDNLVPILTDGLIELCKKTPEDPVDYLAEYLFRRSLDVPYPDPTTY